MRTMIVPIGGGQDNATLPPIIVAARHYSMARRLQCDRIRVELVGGARIADFPLATIERFLVSRQLTLQPDAVAHHGRAWELHRPMWALGHSPEARKETTTP